MCNRPMVTFWGFLNSLLNKLLNKRMNLITKQQKTQNAEKLFNPYWNRGTFEKVVYAWVGHHTHTHTSRSKQQTGWEKQTRRLVGQRMNLQQRRLPAFLGRNRRSRNVNCIFINQSFWLFIFGQTKCTDRENASVDLQGCAGHTTLELPQLQVSTGRNFHSSF